MNCINKFCITRIQIRNNMIEKWWNHPRIQSRDSWHDEPMLWLILNASSDSPWYLSAKRESNQVEVFIASFEHFDQCSSNVVSKFIGTLCRKLQGQKLQASLNSYQNVVSENRVVIDKYEVVVAVFKIGVNNFADWCLINSLSEAITINRCRFFSVKFWVIQNAVKIVNREWICRVVSKIKQSKPHGTCPSTSLTRL